MTTSLEKPVNLTLEQVRELLAEGRKCREELEKRLDKMHQINPLDALQKAK